MKTSILGSTGLEVTNLGFGAMELKDTIENGGRLPTEEHAGAVLNAVLDSGINFIDTSWCYDRSEEFIGRFVSHRRNEYVLATKCGHWWRNDPDHSGWSHEGMMNCIDQSLERMKTDHVDILQVRSAALSGFGWSPEDLDIREAFALFRLSSGPTRQLKGKWAEQVDTALAMVGQLLGQAQPLAIG